MFRPNLSLFVVLTLAGCKPTGDRSALADDAIQAAGACVVNDLVECLDPDAREADGLLAHASACEDMPIAGYCHELARTPGFCSSSNDIGKKAGTVFFYPGDRCANLGSGPPSTVINKVRTSKRKR